MRQSNSSKIRNTPLCIKFFETEAFWNSKRSPSRIFCVTRKFSDIFFVIPLLYGLLNIFCPTNDPRSKKFHKHPSLSRHKRVRAKTMIPLPPYVKFFDARNFQKQQWVPLRNFSVLWDNFFCDFPSIVHSNFRSLKFLIEKKLCVRNRLIYSFFILSKTCILWCDQRV